MQVFDMSGSQQQSGDVHMSARVRCLTCVNGQAKLERPQEVLMWEQFAEDVRAVRACGKPNPHWPRIAELTQRVVLAVEESAKHGNKQVRLQKGSGAPNCL